MCGIAGVVGGQDTVTAATTVRRMLDALARRGPDGEGLERVGAATLGHRRLSIFDLSEAGRQPMSSEDGIVSVVFNGAIYNFPELRGQLAAAGHVFRSRTDTEVLLHGYRAWGIDELVARIRGMYAFAMWDARTERLFLVRDRLGVKPLTYVLTNGTIAFASTVRALAAAGLAHDLSPKAIAEFLEYGFVSDARSIYAGVAKLPPASIGEWHRGSFQTRRYWTPAAPHASTPLSFADAVGRTEELLLRAVRMRLHADVPVAALLSGGIDSGLVCWAITRVGGDVTAYTVSAPGDPGDEAADAASTARELGLQHRVLTLTDTTSGDFGDFIAAYAEPFAVESGLGLLRISEAISHSSVKVLLTGDGGDDVFLGYPRNRHLLLAQRLARFTPSAATPVWRALRPMMPGRGPLRRAARLADYVTGGLAAYLGTIGELSDYRAQGILGERLADVTLPESRGWSVESARTILRDQLEHAHHHRFVAEYLTKVDGATMHHGLEARSPFLDHELWDFASSLPFEMRLKGGRLKAVLRELARRHIGPRVATLRKRGFSVPVLSWMERGWRREVEATLHESLLERDGWIRARRAIDTLRTAEDTDGVPRKLWFLYVLERWLRHERATLGATPTATERAVERM